MSTLKELIEDGQRKREESDYGWNEIKKDRERRDRQNADLFNQQIEPFKKQFVNSGLASDLKYFCEQLQSKGLDPTAGEVISLRNAATGADNGTYYLPTVSSPSEFDKGTPSYKIHLGMVQELIGEGKYNISKYGIRIAWEEGKGGRKVDVFLKIDPVSRQVIFSLFPFQRYPYNPEPTITTNLDEIQQRLAVLLKDT
jgi:hypothetical protein